MCSSDLDSLKIAVVLFFISGVGSAWPELGFTSINPDNTVPVYLEIGRASCRERV